MHAIEVYQTYLALKQHFSDNNYDYFKYNGKVRVNETNFLARKDKFFFEKLSRKFDNKNDLRDYFMSNLIKNPNVWIREMIGPHAEKNYMNWKAFQESMSYNFKQDILHISDTYVDTKFNDLFLCYSGQHPKLLESYTNQDISIEALMAFDELFGCFKDWNKYIDDPIVWPGIYNFTQRYNPFIEIDVKDFRESLVNEFMPF